ncbi:hypothetical protein [Arthrobacter wenxiniae]|uniref:hypothetical protein n=1 Tax=Arthrobacter wenxiniae TaxID=2713570 RepID=UPI003CCD6D0F
MANHRRIGSERLLQRIRRPALPPAWSEVWMASQSHVHIQATGVAAAGRTQYTCHARRRAFRDGGKFTRSRSLPNGCRASAEPSRATCNKRRMAAVVHWQPASAPLTGRGCASAAPRQRPRRRPPPSLSREICSGLGPADPG